MGAVVKPVTKAVDKVLANTPIVGQPLREVHDETLRPLVNDLAKHHIDPNLVKLGKVLGLGFLAPKPPALIEPPEPPDIPEPDPQTSSRQFKTTNKQGMRIEKRKTGVEGGPLSSILLAPSVLGTNNSQLADKGNL